MEAIIKDWYIERATEDHANWFVTQIYSQIPNLLSIGDTLTIELGDAGRVLVKIPRKMTCRQEIANLVYAEMVDHLTRVR